MVLKFFHDYANNRYRCSLIDNKIFSNIKIEDAKKIIRTIKFDSMKIEEERIIAKKDDLEIIIEDLDKCNIFFDLIKNNYQLIKKQLKTKKQSPKVFPLNIIKKQALLNCGLLIITISGLKLLSSIEPTKVEAAPVELLKYERIMEINEQEQKEIKNELQKEVKKDEEKISEEPENIVEISYGSLVDTETYKNSYKLHHESVEDASEAWGLDSDLVMAILTQESGGVLENLMQITFKSFEGGSLTSYNYKLNKKQTYFFTDDQQYQTNEKYIVVRSSDLKDKNKNIFLGALIIRVNIDNYQNIMAGSLGFNQGPGNMNKIFAATELATGLSKEEQLANNGIIYYDYASASHAGDDKYLFNVFRYYNSDKITYKKRVDGETVEITINLRQTNLDKIKQIKK